MRRSLAILSLAALVAASLGACSTTSTTDFCASTTEQAATVCPGGTTVKGVDISHYDGTIDWATAHGSGIDFAFAKATESTNYTDPTFATNWAGMKAAGVVRGAYHFFHADVDPTAQMTFFVQAIQSAGGLQPGDLPPAIDFEVTNNVASATIAANLATAITALQKATGMKPIVYTSPGFANPILPSGFGSDSTLWVANWQVSCPNTPSAWSAWAFWQSADNGTVPGITGATAVDLDEFNGTLAQLQGFGGSTPAGDAGGPPPADGGSAGKDAGGGSSSSGSSSGSSSSGSSSGSGSGASGASSSGGSSGSGSGGTPSAGGSDGGTSSGSAGHTGPCGGH